MDSKEAFGPEPDQPQTDVTSPLRQIQEAHRFDPNLPQAKADEISAALETADPETIAEIEKTLATKSPYEEVQAAVREIDNEEYASTLRAWVIGLLSVTGVSGVNMFLSMRSPAITIPAVVVILVTYPIGVLWAKVVPTRRFTTFGVA